MNKIGVKLFASFLCMAAVTIALLWLIQAGLLRDSSLDGRLQNVRKSVEAAVQVGCDFEGLVQMNYGLAGPIETVQGLGRIEVCLGRFGLLAARFQQADRIFQMREGRFWLPLRQA